jgi:hypothetical protein
MCAAHFAAHRRRSKLPKSILPHSRHIGARNGVMERAKCARQAPEGLPEGAGGAVGGQEGVKVTVIRWKPRERSMLFSMSWVLRWACANSELAAAAAWIFC